MPDLQAAGITSARRRNTTSMGRLPTNVKPIHYDISIEPDLESSTFEGAVSIDLMVLETSTSITLNTVDLDIQTTEIWAEGLVITTSPDLSYTEDTQMLKISFDKPLHAGTIGRLRQTFTGHISNSMAGISVSKYKDAGGKSRHILSTVLSPIDARRAFPCFDEPALKASFTVTAVAEKHLTCLGNMEVASEKSVLSGINGVKKKAVTFHPTPHMSTYLLCLVIGEFGMIQSNDFRVPIRIFTTPDNKIEHCKFALDLAVRTMKLYETTFDILYPLRKLDMVTIPERLGATESWGLIQYAARELIYDEKNSNLTAKQDVADTVQHELAHQWFGNLVTSEYWDDIWLNEGFATWMAWYSSNIFFPQWKIWQNHVLTVLQAALSVDSLRSSHPIEVPITGTSDVGQVFDAITYLKGSSLLRMISMRIGESTFLRGVQTYLKRHAYGNARTSDLWAALSEASGEDIGEVMSIWSQNTGYPVIVVSEDQSSMQIRIQQNRFLKTGDVKKEEDKTLFPIFLRARTEEGAIEDLTVIYREQTFSTKGLKWLKLNADQFGFYRTSYSPARMEKLTEAANSGSLSIEDRIGIIMDAGALATAGYQRTSEVLSLINKLSLESNYFIWTTVLTQIEAVRKALIFEDPKLKNAFENFTRSLVSSGAHRIGWTLEDDEDELQQQIKPLLFAAAGLAGDRKIIRDAFAMFEGLVHDDEYAIPPSLRLPVYQIVLKYGGTEEYDAILDQSRIATDVESRDTAYRALGQSSDPSLIQRTLDLSLSGEVAGQGVKYVLIGLRAHQEGVAALWSWLKHRWHDLLKRFGSGMDLFILTSIIEYCTASLTTSEQLKGVQTFFEHQTDKRFNRIIEKSIDAIRAQVRWIERDRLDIEHWLRSGEFYVEGPDHTRILTPHR